MMETMMKVLLFHLNWISFLEKEKEPLWNETSGESHCPVRLGLKTTGSLPHWGWFKANWAESGFIWDSGATCLHIQESSFPECETEVHVGASEHADTVFLFFGVFFNRIKAKMIRPGWSKTWKNMFFIKCTGQVSSGTVFILNFR